MAALMTFIDPRQKAAQVKWWDEATKGKGNDIVKAVSDWRKTFMLRRTKGILQDKLPPRERSCLDVPAKPSEIAVYEAYEAMFISALNRLQEEIDDSNQKAQREMMDIMMACMACMRMVGESSQLLSLGHCITEMILTLRVISVSHPSDSSRRSRGHHPVFAYASTPSQERGKERKMCAMWRQISFPKG